MVKAALIIVALVLVLAAGVAGSLYLRPSQKSSVNAPKVSSTESPKPIKSLINSKSPSLAEPSFSLKFNPKGKNEFEVDVQTTTTGEFANLFSVKLNYDPSIMEVTNVAPASIIKLWADRAYDNKAGLVSLIGGVPSPGYQTKAFATLAKLQFKTKKVGEAKIDFGNTSAIYRNSDNKDILTTTHGLLLTVGSNGITLKN